MSGYYFAKSQLAFFEAGCGGAGQFTALDIIKRLDDKSPQGEVHIAHISDVHLGADFGFIYQYIFGLTAQDPGDGTFEHYKSWVRAQLGARQLLRDRFARNVLQARSHRPIL